MIIKVYVSTHKKYRMPNDKMYIPIQSGCALYPNLGYQRDDVGENISDKNAAYNNLCPLYWAWKHSDADYIGIVHYRRHFLGPKKKNWTGILTKEEAEKLCKKYPIIMPTKSHYPFFTMESHYINTFKELKSIHTNDLKTLRKVIADLYPGCEKAYDKVMKKSSGHQGNISIMRKDYFDSYCSFMFSILFECEKRLQGHRHDYNRYIAGISEFIPDIWLEYNGYKYAELKLFKPEEPSTIRRIYNLGMRMFFGKRDPHRYNPNTPK